MITHDIDLPMESIKTLCERYQVRELALFGSALGDRFRSDSDLDFLVEFEPEAQVGFMKLARMQREFSALCHRKPYFPAQKYFMRREELYLTDDSG